MMWSTSYSYSVATVGASMQFARTVGRYSMLFGGNPDDVEVLEDKLAGSPGPVLALIAVDSRRI